MAISPILLLAVLVVALAGAGFLTYRFAAWQRQAQEDLERALAEADTQRERLVAVLRSVPHGLLVLDHHGTVIVANGQAAALWGLAGAEITGLSLRTLGRRDVFRCDGEPWQLADVLVEAEVSTGRSLWVTNPRPVEVETVASGRVLEVTGTPVWSVAGGGWIGTIVLFRDVTEIRQLERLRENLTHMLVHDLRTPLSGILTSIVALLSDEEMEGKVIRQVLGVARRSAERMLRMVEALVDVARLEAGEMPVEQEMVRLGEVVEGAIAQVVPQAEAKGLELDVRIEPADLTTWADRGLLERVIVNLVGNAVKFTPRGGDVAVRGQEEDDGGILLWVRDSGPGIPLEDQARIFDRFTQAGQRRQWGSGLGLTFCKLAVEAHGGRIWVESAPGKGSTFYVRLPAGGGEQREWDGR